MAGTGEGADVALHRLAVPAGEGGDEKSEHGEQRGRQEHRGAGAVDGDRFQTGPAAEGTPQEPRAVADGEHRAGHHAGQCHGVGEPPGQQRLEGGLLADESQERRDPGHRGRRGHAAAQSQGAERRRPLSSRRSRVPVEWSTTPTIRKSDALNSACAEQHADARDRGVPGARAEQHGQETQLAHRAVGEQLLEIVLAQGPPAAQHHGEQAEGYRRPPPDGQFPERRAQPGEQVDPGLHHRRGVQVGGDRGRRGHGGGQPQAEREDRRLRQRSDQDRRHRRRDQATGRRVGDDPGDPVGPRGLAEHDHAGEHRQPAGRGDGQRLHRGPAAGPALGDVADQQVGTDRGQLPEHVQQQQVVGDHQPEHRPGERHQHPAEPAEPSSPGAK